MKQFHSNINYKVLGLGTAGGEIVKQLLTVGFPSERLFYFDTDRNAIKRSGLSNRFILGELITKGKGTKGRRDLAARIYRENQELFEKLMADDCLYIIVGGLCGGTFGGIIEPLQDYVKTIKRKYVVAAVMPDGSSDKQTMQGLDVLKSINVYTDKVVLLVKELVVRQLEALGGEEGYVKVNERMAKMIQKLLDPNSIRVMESDGREEVRLFENVERIKHYIDGYDWLVAHMDSSIIVANTNRALLEVISGKTDQVFTVSSRKFEELTAFMYQDTGFETELTKPSRDGGVDIRVKTVHGLAGTPFITVIQAKLLTKKKVSRIHVQQLEGARADEKAERGMVVTNTDYTKDSIQYAKRNKIDLMKFFDLMQEYNRVKSFVPENTKSLRGDRLL